MTEPNHAPKQVIIPVSTYRLQLNKQFTFADAARIVPYLHQLGISHCYTSPYLKARPGSAHGYDIVDHHQLNPELGSSADFDELLAQLQRYGMGLVTDIVPNHMGVMGCDNKWWLDVLENGQASSYARFFDIDWYPMKKSLQHKLLIPVLGGHYGDILSQQELQLVFDADQGEFSIGYYQHKFPIDPQTYPFILNAQHPQLTTGFNVDDPVLLEYQTIENSFSKLPLRTETSVEKNEERNRDKEVFKKHLARLCADNPSLRHFIRFRITEISQVMGENSELHKLLELQAYRLADWRVAGDEINYRRFFDINDLAGIRVEDENVFTATHEFILTLIGQGKIHGLRIDHADGLHDPVGYYQRLNQKISQVLDLHCEPDVSPLYIVAEKIVANYEYLSSNWPINGTTGYEFANIANGVFIDTEAENTLSHCYLRFIGQRLDFGELAYSAKKLMMDSSMASELNVLVNQLGKIADADSKTRDYTFNSLHDALSEVIACFPVYRTYINSPIVSKEDAQYIHWAIAQAQQRSQAADKSVFGFIHDILNLAPSQIIPMPILLQFVMKFQQYTSPVMAKGCEDSAIYQYHRLISLNEVGGDPQRFGYSVSAFHHFNQERLKKWPHTMLCLSTHDSKHGTDVRARIDVLSEVPQQWQAAVHRWRRLNKLKKTKKQQAVISRNDEYLFYQILVGTWPLTEMDTEALLAYRQRLEDYMRKAIREAKQHTSWLNPCADYEQAVSRFIQQCLDSRSGRLFLDDFISFEKSIRTAGLYNALAQTLLLLTAPGMPDIYQGNELWQFVLVDPDNRRPVDFNKHRQLMTDMDVFLEKPGIDRLSYIGSLLANFSDGRIKLFIIMQSLRFRQRYAELFADGEYLKITTAGQAADQLLAFARKDGAHVVIIIVPRLIARFCNNTEDQTMATVWGDTWLDLPANSPSRYLELFSQTPVSTVTANDSIQLFVRDALKALPLAILSSNVV